ncbi:uncharacterized protein LOC131165925 isoform X2 [Malania oleifera]|uniref:uncharacterized protein LOC131165925 isoform X2 n=1 Tax=Malania oleifera TaxID=397392 RepID=UPI0025AEB783|nr:uncharacterized protein LOC131165925 isoform X2 [Malania oleifera]
MAATLSLLKLGSPKNPLCNPRNIPCLPSPPKLTIPTRPLHPKLLLQETIRSLESASVPLTALAFPFFLDPKDAVAVGGEFGLLEGRTLALIHPFVMGCLFFYTLWAGYLGWQWRRVRTIQSEINELKKQVKPVPVSPEGSPVAEAAPSPIEAKIQQLTEERKELVKGSFRDRHFNAGSILLAFGVFEAIGGGVNTWFRTGKLFPGPHLFAGAALGFFCRQELQCYGQRQRLSCLQCRKGVRQLEIFTLH